MLCLTGCGGSSAGSTSGPAFEPPSQVRTAVFDEAQAQGAHGALIDISSVNQGYVAASAVNVSGLKLQVLNGPQSYNYDLRNDGTPCIFPVNMGDGRYTFRIMQNTSGSNYLELTAVTADVALDSEFEPYLAPSEYCEFSQNSAAAQKARELVSSAQNEGDALAAVYDWITQNIVYDEQKAASLQNVGGYVPSPDATLAQGAGICFDYASLGAAMLRSLGIPCQIVTGYVSPDGIYHAWNMVHIDGTWVSASVDVQAGTWSRIDLTFAAGGNSAYIGDGTSYTDRYVY